MKAEYCASNRQMSINWSGRFYWLIGFYLIFFIGFIENMQYQVIASVQDI